MQAAHYYCNAIKSNKTNAEITRIKARAGRKPIVTATGTRLEQLKNLAKVLAKQIDVCTTVGDAKSMQLVPQLSRPYRETIREIEEIEGTERNDDEISELLSARKADGKSEAVC